MDTAFFQAFIMSFREGLEAFLIIGIMLKFLDKINEQKLKKHVWTGAILGLGVSLIFGLLLYKLSEMIGGIKTTAKLWESGASFIAVIFVASFVVWMIKNGSKIKQHIEKEIALNLAVKGIILLVLFMVAREGAEIAIFSFAGKYAHTPILLGISTSMLVALLINFSLVKVNLKVIFQITLIYLILQAGYLLGYSLHEGLSALKEMQIIDSDHLIFNKAFNLYDTLLNHKKGILGMPLNVLFGWYSKPEWIQFLAQYAFTFGLLYYFKRNND
jgi:high-affinity iron transporter